MVHEQVSIEQELTAFVVQRHVRRKVLAAVPRAAHDAALALTIARRAGLSPRVVAGQLSRLLRSGSISRTGSPPRYYVRRAA